MKDGQYKTRQKPTRAALEKLLFAPPQAPAITMYMPTHKAAAPPLLHEDQVRFKTLSAKILEILRARDEADAKLTRKVERRLAGIQHDVEFWKHQTEGLLVCTSTDQVMAYNLPLDCDEYVAVDARYHLSPVIGLLDFSEAFYVLKIARKHPALLAGDMYGLQPTKIKLPESVQAALHIDEWKEGSVQSHTIAGAAGAEWHGQGGAKDRGDEERRMFLRIIDDAICANADTSRPLIIAGTEEIASEYRQVTQYPHVLPDYVANYAQPEDMLAAVRQKIYDDVIQERHKKLAAALAQNPVRTATAQPALENVVEKGNTAVLLLGLIQHTTDSVRETHGQPVSKLTFPPDEQMARLDYLAATTWRLGGEVVTLDQTLIKPHVVAALLRY